MKQKLDQRKPNTRKGDDEVVELLQGSQRREQISNSKMQINRDNSLKRKYEYVERGKYQNK